MEYKVCILAAGKGTRMAEFCTELNKALLPVRGKPAISYVIENYPEDVEIVFALGYLGGQIKQFVTNAYPERKFTFVEVDNWGGAGSGPGYSLLCCKDQLQCPFVLANVDALTIGKIPEPSHNWFGVGEIKSSTARFCSVAVDEEGTILRIDDKIETDNKYAFTGIAGIYDYEKFWNALEGNDELISGEYQVSNGFQALLEAGLKIAVLDWYDTGTPESYERIRKNFPKQNT